MYMNTFTHIHTNPYKCAFTNIYLLNSDNKGSSGGSSQELHATKKALGTVTEEGDNKTCRDNIKYVIT
jgi:hypothetical protein